MSCGCTAFWSNEILAVTKMSVNSFLSLHLLGLIDDVNRAQFKPISIHAVGSVYYCGEYKGCKIRTELKACLEGFWI